MRYVLGNLLYTLFIELFEKVEIVENIRSLFFNEKQEQIEYKSKYYKKSANFNRSCLRSRSRRRF